MKNLLAVLLITAATCANAEPEISREDMSLPVQIFLNVYERESVAMSVIVGLQECGYQGLADALTKKKEGKFEHKALVLIQDLEHSNIGDDQIDAMQTANAHRISYMLGLKDGFKAIMTTNKEAFCSSMTELADKEMQK